MGKDVRELQTYLLRGGYLPKGNKAKNIPPAIDGDFGARTKKAVQNFQRKNKLAADGIVGPATIKALRDKYKRKWRLGIIHALGACQQGAQTCD